MRILHVTDVYRPRVGGIELFVEELAQRQVRQGHEVTVLSQTAGGSGRTPSGVVVERSPFSGSMTLNLPFDARPGYTAYDVVHAHLSVVSPFATRALRSANAAGVPTVGTVHSIWSGREGWVRLVGSIAGWRRWPTVWTSVSGVAAASVGAVVPRDAPVLVVTNAIDVPWWRGRTRLPDPQRPLTFVTVMRLAGRKRPLELLDMLASLHTSVPDLDWRVVFVGDGPLAGRVRRQAHDLGIAERVELTGELTRSQVREVYLRSDVYVAPAYRESFGLAPLEARSVGLPVVAMRSGGVGEFVRHGVEGLLCEDDDDMARALAELATDRLLLEAAATHNREHEPLIGWQATLDGFEAAYARAAERAEHVASGSGAHARRGATAPRRPE